MPASKVQNESEIRRWFEEGRTYQWMVEEYSRKYHLTVVPSMFGNLRRRRGWERRIQRDDDLVPWAVAGEHRHTWDVGMLRAEACRRAGVQLAPKTARDLAGWRTGLDLRDEVVDYDSARGFRHVPRRAGVDLDLIREPEQKTTRRRRAE